MNKNTSLDRLNEHLFDVIERLKSNKDEKADECEKIDIETASAIAEIGKIVVDGYKVKAQVLNIVAKTENPRDMTIKINESGIVELPQNYGNRLIEDE